MNQIGAVLHELGYVVAPLRLYTLHALAFAHQLSVRTQRWKLVVRAYYRTSLVAFDTIEEVLGFSYPLLFDMTTPHPERYSQARDNPDALATLEAYLTRGRSEFEPLRTRPAPKTVP